MAEKEDVKVADPPTAETGKDERGVPWEQRAKEFERKFNEAKAEAETLKASRVEEPKVETQEELRKRLEDFATDPDGYIERVYEGRKRKEEFSNVIPFLKSQEGYTSEDNVRLVQIEKDYDLQSSSPLARARAAWDILQKEKLAVEVGKLRSNSGREAELKSGPEGSGRSAPQSNTPKRAELLAQLAISEKKGDLQSSAKLVDMLSDVRE